MSASSLQGYRMRIAAALGAIDVPRPSTARSSRTARLARRQMNRRACGRMRLQSDA
jgi:hypothetical protein